ncbi:hypothetical protein ACQP3C_30635, partial [Escherichia coli]
AEQAQDFIFSRASSLGRPAKARGLTLFQSGGDVQLEAFLHQVRLAWRSPLAFEKDPNRYPRGWKSED